MVKVNTQFRRVMCRENNVGDKCNTEYIIETYSGHLYESKLMVKQAVKTTK